MSKSLSLLTKNERMSEPLVFLSESLIFSQKTSNLLRKPMSEFPVLPFCAKNHLNFFKIVSERKNNFRKGKNRIIPQKFY